MEGGGQEQTMEVVLVRDNGAQAKVEMDRQTQDILKVSAHNLLMTWLLLLLFTRYPAHVLGDKTLLGRALGSFHHFSVFHFTYSQLFFVSSFLLFCSMTKTVPGSTLQIIYYKPHCGQAAKTCFTAQQTYLAFTSFLSFSEIPPIP